MILREQNSIFWFVLFPKQDQAMDKSTLQKMMTFGMKIKIKIKIKKMFQKTNGASQKCFLF